MSAPLEVRLYTTLVAFLQQVQRDAEAALAPEGIHPAHYFILATLRREGAATQAELARRLGVTAANVSQLLAKLEQARLVRRMEEGKSKVASLTAGGAALVARLAPAHDAFLRERFAVLSASDRKALLRLLRLLVRGD